MLFIFLGQIMESGGFFNILLSQPRSWGAADLFMPSSPFQRSSKTLLGTCQPTTPSTRPAWSCCGGPTPACTSATGSWRPAASSSSPRLAAPPTSSLASARGAGNSPGSSCRGPGERRTAPPGGRGGGGGGIATTTTGGGVSPRRRGVAVHRGEVAPGSRRWGFDGLRVSEA